MSAKLTLAEANALIAGAIAYAETKGYKMAIAVVDAGGHPIAMATMDGASIIAAESVIHKARAAVWFGRPTADAVESGKEWPHVYLSFVMANQGAITLSKGGFPIRRDGEIIGGIGAAGGTGAQDVEVSEGGLRAAGYLP
ncbi:MAG: heme-binding protein [Dehalococcoidia bacterium]|nr:heme-binding protein [Dehalococcoidia bacterium]